MLPPLREPPKTIGFSHPIRFPVSYRYNKLPDILIL
jgi:hypothetical protein